MTLATLELASGSEAPRPTTTSRVSARLGYRRVVVFPYFLFTGVLVKRIYDAVDEAQALYPDIEFLKAPYLSDHPLVVDTFLDRVQEMLVGQNLMNCAMCKYREQVLGFEAEVGLAQESHHHHVEGIGGGLENCPCGGDCDSSCRDEAFCKLHGLPFTPLHSHDHGHDHSHDHDHAHGHHHHDHAHPHVHTHAAPAHALLNPGALPLPGFTPPVSPPAAAPDHHHHPYPHADHPLGPVTLPKVPGKLAREARRR